MKDRLVKEGVSWHQIDNHAHMINLTAHITKIFHEVYGIWPNKRRQPVCIGESYSTHAVHVISRNYHANDDENVGTLSGTSSSVMKYNTIHRNVNMQSHFQS